MNTKFCTMYQEALAKAFIVLTPQGKRLAIFPYGAGEDDVPEKQARKHAWLFLNRLNGQAEAQEEGVKFARYIVVPTSGQKWAVMDTTRTHNVNVSVFNTEREAMLGAALMNNQEKELAGKPDCICGKCKHLAIDKYCPISHAYIRDNSRPGCEQFEKIEEE